MNPRNSQNVSVILLLGWKGKHCAQINKQEIAMVIFMRVGLLWCNLHVYHLTSLEVENN